MTVDRLKAQYEAAAATRDEALDGLKRDGQPRFMPQEEQERRAKIDGQYRQAIDAVKAELATTITAAESEIVASGASDPLSRLSNDDLARAANRREFLREDWEVLPPETLAQRVRDALARGDKAESALHHRYLQAALGDRFKMDMHAGPLLKPLLSSLESVLVDVAARDRAQQTIRDAESLQVQMVGHGFLERTYGRGAVPDRRSA
jgi:hypothetical protein